MINKDNIVLLKPANPIPDDLWFTRLMDTEDLKGLWDDFERDENFEFGVVTNKGTVYIDEVNVHQVLNERGEGKYCAV